MPKRMTRRELLRYSGIAASAGLLAACQPQVVKETVIVEKEKVVKETVEVEKVVREAVEVEKEVTRVVEKVVEVDKAAQVKAHLVWDTFRGQGTAFKWNEERMLAFKDKFPNVEIEFRPSPGNQQAMYGRYMALNAAGDLGDLVSFDPGLYHLRRAVNADLLLPLDDLMAADGLDLSEWFDVFIELQRYEGHIWGLPNWGWAGFDVLVTNALHFEEAGIELSAPDAGGPPMETIGEWARKFYEEGKRYGLQMNIGQHAATECTTRAFGGNVIDEEGTKCLLLDDKSREAMKWMYDMCVVDKVIPQGEDLKPAGAGALVAGKLTMFQCGSLCTVNAAKAVTDKTICKVTQFLYPKQPDGPYINSVRCGSWNVAKHTKHAEAAYQFTKHIAGREGTIGFNLFGGNGALTRPDAFIALEAANPMYAWFKKPLADGMPMCRLANGRGPEYTDILRQYTQKLMDKYNPIPFEQGLQELNDAVQKILDKPMD